MRRCIFVVAGRLDGLAAGWENDGTEQLARGRVAYRRYRRFEREQVLRFTVKLPTFTLLREVSTYVRFRLLSNFDERFQVVSILALRLRYITTAVSPTVV